MRDRRVSSPREIQLSSNLSDRIANELCPFSAGKIRSRDIQVHAKIYIFATAELEIRHIFGESRSEILLVKLLEDEEASSLSLSLSLSESASVVPIDVKNTEWTNK